VEINWFTFFAQIINFLILIALLRRFLYGPIARVMADRKQKVKHRLQEADSKMHEAIAEADRYREKHRQLDAQREELLKEARERAQEERKMLLQKLREEVETSQSRWYEAIAAEREAFLDELRRRTTEQVWAIARQVLRDLADARLEEQAIRVFLDRLQTSDRTALQAAIAEGNGQIAIGCAFELCAERRQAIADYVHRELDAEATVEFYLLPESICGIHLHAGGRELSWSVGHYLQSLEETIASAIAPEPEEALN